MNSEILFSKSGEEEEKFCRERSDEFFCIRVVF